jgi:hypothetical protein
MKVNGNLIKLLSVAVLLATTSFCVPNPAENIQEPGTESNSYPEGIDWVQVISNSKTLWVDHTGVCLEESQGGITKTVEAVIALDNSNEILQALQGGNIKAWQQVTSNNITLWTGPEDMVLLFEQGDLKAVCETDPEKVNASVLKDSPTTAPPSNDADAPVIDDPLFITS